MTGRWTIIFLGNLLGWALAGTILLVSSPAAVLLLDAVTFAASIAVLARTTFDRPPTAAGVNVERDGMVAMLRGGVQAARDLHVSVLLLTVISATLAGALISVGGAASGEERAGLGRRRLCGARGDLWHRPRTGNRHVWPAGGEVPTLQRSYFRAQAIGALGIAIMAASPVLAVAMVGAAIAGAGNGLEVARVLQLIQLTVPEKFIGRINGLVHAGEAGAYLAAFVVGGATATLLGVRQTFALSALGLLITASRVTCVCAGSTAGSSDRRRPLDRQSVTTMRTLMVGKPRKMNNDRGVAGTASHRLRCAALRFPCISTHTSFSEAR